MSPSFWSAGYFIGSSGERIDSSELIETITNADDSTTQRIITPRVKEAVRQQFGCDTLRGADLEDDGGSGTMGSHWEQRLFEGEMMDGVGGSVTHTSRHVLTNLTLSLLEDSGWCAPGLRLLRGCSAARAHAVHSCGCLQIRMYTHKRACAAGSSLRSHYHVACYCKYRRSCAPCQLALNSSGL